MRRATTDPEVEGWHQLEAELETNGIDTTDVGRDVAGHAISALRSYGPKSALPHLRRAGPKLEAVLKRPTASPMAKQAQKALERLADAH